MQVDQKGSRRCKSWIDQFVEYTTNTETPNIFKKWVAISTLASALDQKVWIRTDSNLYPNLYTFLIAPPGIGKSRSMGKARFMLEALPESPNKPHIAPTSLNAATVVDQMVDSRHIVIHMPNPPLEYNAMTIMVGEFGTFMSKYEDDLIAMLTDFYDVTPYGQRRRGNGGLKIKIERPLLNMLIGSTPANLMKFMPEGAWDQGFTSRILFIYGETKNMIDDFAEREDADPSDLIHDLTIINSLVGQFKVSHEYQRAVLAWRELGEPPKPIHPRLIHYTTRRKAHLYRLSMIAAIDRSNSLILEKADFNTAMGWLLEAEAEMPKIFTGATAGSDSTAMNEIHHFVLDYNTAKAKTCPEHKLINYARERLPGHAVLRVLDLMIHSKMLVIVSTDARTGVRQFAARDPNLVEVEDASSLLPTD